MRARSFASSIITVVLCCTPCIVCASSQGADSEVQLPKKENFKIVVLAGQSNMAGRGFVQEEDKIPIPRVYMLDKTGNWVPAIDPIHYDKSAAGVCPGRSFAKEMVDADPNIAVGLVPTSCGGSSIDHWLPGVYFGQTKSYPYDDAIARTKRALQDGTLEAILWRQGEADASVEKAAAHAEKLATLFKRFREEFDAPNVPVLVGELFPNQPSKGYDAIRDAQLQVVKELQPAAFVSAEGTKLNPDKVHFDRESQIEQGKRFYKALLELKNKE